MALDATEIAVAGTGHVYRAVLGTAFPANTSTVPAAAWIELGYTTEEGVRFSFSKETTDFMGWQSTDVLRTIATAAPKEIAMDFAQLNQDTWNTAMGGGTWSGTPPNYEYVPPAASAVDEFALLIEATDGTEIYRWGFTRVVVTGSVDFALTRSDPIILPVTVKVLDASPVYKLFTNDADLGA